MKTNNKNTRLFYNDDKHIAMYKAMPPEQFKELMIAMLEYKYGDDSIVDNIQDPMVRALFLSEKVAIDKNEEKWEKRKKINQENGSKGGRPKKTTGFENKKTTGYSEKKPNENVNENVNVECEAKEAAPVEISSLNLSEWYGEYTNVHLTKRQYDLLLSEILDKQKLDELIGELSENIACNNGKAPPYDESNPDMHFAILRKYWRWRKQNGFKPFGTRENKTVAIKDELDKLTEQYRLKECGSG